MSESDAGAGLHSARIPQPDRGTEEEEEDEEDEEWALVLFSPDPSSLVVVQVVWGRFLQW